MSKTVPKDIVETDEGIELRVAAGSSASSLAGVIANYFLDGKRVILLAMGAGAVNQAIKACCIARGYVAPRGENLLVLPGFKNILIEDLERSIIKLVLVRG